MSAQREIFSSSKNIIFCLISISKKNTAGWANYFFTQPPVGALIWTPEPASPDNYEPITMNELPTYIRFK